MVPFFGWALLADGGDSVPWRLVAFALFVLAMITDKIDGDIARARDLVTNFGKIADPIADKAITGMAFVGLSIVGDIWWWVTILVLLREWRVTLLRLWVLRHVVIAAGAERQAQDRPAGGRPVGPAAAAPSRRRPRRRLRPVRPRGEVLFYVGQVCLAGAVAMTLWSGYEFFRDVWRQRTCHAWQLITNRSPELRQFWSRDWATAGVRVTPRFFPAVALGPRAAAASLMFYRSLGVHRMPSSPQSVAVALGLGLAVSASSSRPAQRRNPPAPASSSARCTAPAATPAPTSTPTSSSSTTRPARRSIAQRQVASSTAPPPARRRRHRRRAERHASPPVSTSSSQISTAGADGSRAADARRDRAAVIRWPLAPAVFLADNTLRDPRPPADGSRGNPGRGRHGRLRHHRDHLRDRRTATLTATSSAPGPRGRRHRQQRRRLHEHAAPDAGARLRDATGRRQRTIAEIQGTGADDVPLVGRHVDHPGVVTAAYPTGGFNGFYIQTAGTGGATDATRAPPTRSSSSAASRAGDRRPASATSSRSPARSRVRRHHRDHAGSRRRRSRADRRPARGHRAEHRGLPDDRGRAGRRTRASCSRPTGPFTVTNTFDTNNTPRSGWPPATTR